ncbi:sugar porter family MFS transporter [Asanoa sp. WMMD1127]|uniref:sugar porter family MFS transporter n=1 Tax=Asanoa sp. WMMD1127 TaxID=3016107 RepID=UPI002415B2D6|nr:sugar porter family MFS transporter [Asanoa sp. WMMD1127]MDG4826187.1 sugar porter family MFS transporter [Asanoa sp. WMMD1127]
MSRDASGPEPSDVDADGGSTPRRRRGGVVLVSSAAALGGFLFGYDTSVINGTVDAIEDQFNMSSELLGFVVSSALLGAAVGAWFAGPIADRIGRVRSMVIAAVLFFIGAIGSALATGPVTLTVWRIIGGMAVGAASVIAPAYIAEMAPARLRGRLGSLQQLAIVLGIFVALLIDALLANIAGSAADELALGGKAWRWMFATAAVPAILYGLISLTIPESPRYLVRRGNVEQARKTLRRYVGGDTDERIKEIQHSLGTGAEDVRLRDLRGPRLGLQPIVWTGILLSVFQQFVGINVIFYYSTTLWRSVGFQENDALLISVITSLVNIVGTFIGIALIDRIGRKALLLIGASVMFVTLGLLSYCFSKASGSGTDVSLASPWDTIALYSANVYVLSFAFSWGPAVWVLLGEMFNNRIRATALAVAAAAQWLANFAISQTFPTLSGVSLTLAYGLYTAFALLALVFVAAAVRETKGRELETM